ncbi:MAG TPA: DUF4388 domain-containing protein [Gemmatimonadaceae bacterium]|nr:DUF4388 domain-containing protein [Gemmatimonadaceae bacterium]
MAIEGPLRELGIHDVFQLLDLSRKTGTLRVTSDLREDEGVVAFDNGRVVQATIRSKPVTTEEALMQAGRVSEADVARARSCQQNGRANRDVVDLLVEIGAITQRELERQLRLQIESVVFELMSWREGFFRFDERPRDEIAVETRISVSTESLLMEGARRIDEWSRIDDVIPNLDVVPELAPVENDREGTMLDLLPHEWQVLTMIDGERNLRAIAASLGRDEFEIAKIAYGLATTGVVVAGAAKSTRATPDSPVYAANDPSLPMTTIRFVAADLTTARSAVEQLLKMSPSGPVAADARDALDAIAKLQRVLEVRPNG